MSCRQDGSPDTPRPCASRTSTFTLPDFGKSSWLRNVVGAGRQSTTRQVVVKHDGRRDVIELRLELKRFSHQGEVERAILVILRERFTDFWKNYEMKLYDFRVVPCEPGSLRGNH